MQTNMVCLSVSLVKLRVAEEKLHIGITLCWLLLAFLH